MNMRLKIRVTLYLTLAGIILYVYYLVYARASSLLLPDYRNVSNSIKRYPSLTLAQFSAFNISREDRYNWSNSASLQTELASFAPALNVTEYKLYLELIRVFKTRCESFNITYILEGGSLLGAYRYHGFIPWDDDFDVKLHISQKPVLKRLLDATPAHSADTSEVHVWKFWNDKKSWLTKKGVKWQWPFIDILFFEDNNTHIFDVSPDVNGRLVYTKSDIFPLQLEIFENMLLPVPCNMRAYLNAKYKVNEICSSSARIHNAEKDPDFPVKSVPCHYLSHVYPFVHRIRTGNFLYEELRLGNKVLYRIGSWWFSQVNICLLTFPGTCSGEFVV